VIGLLLGILTVRTTYLQPGQNLGGGWYEVFAPVIVLAVPLYDLIVVSTIRMLRGQSPFKGDTNHFSHRLVARGMSKRTAVLCLYLVSAATAVAAIILPHVPNTFTACARFRSDGSHSGRVMLLEQHPLPMPRKVSRRVVCRQRLYRLPLTPNLSPGERRNARGWPGPGGTAGGVDSWLAPPPKERVTRASLTLQRSRRMLPGSVA